MVRFKNKPTHGVRCFLVGGGSILIKCINATVQDRVYKEEQKKVGTKYSYIKKVGL